MNNILEITARQSRANAWFETMRDEICGAFEALEDEARATLYREKPARFVRRHGSAPNTRAGGKPVPTFRDHAL